MYDIQSFDPGLGTTLVEFQAIVERNKFMGYNHGKKSIRETKSCFRDTRIEDLCLDFSIPGYPDFVSSGCSAKMVRHSFIITSSYPFLCVFRLINHASLQVYSHFCR